MDRAVFQRVNVIGTSGSGKSTFARKLAAVMNSPYIEMDLLFWKPNWVESTNDEFFAKLEEALRGESWVLDGNYQRTQKIKWKYVTAVVWLDFSFNRNLYQIIMRSLVRSIFRPELWPGTGNRESFLRMFVPKTSIISWMIQTHPTNRVRYEAAMNDPSFAHIHFVRLRSPAEAEIFLEQLRQGSTVSKAGNE